MPPYFVMKLFLWISFLASWVSGSAWALSTNELAYCFDFNQGSNPARCIYGSSNMPLLSSSSFSYQAANVVWNESGGVKDSGYLRTKPVTADSLKLSSPLPVLCTDFSFSFHVRRYSGVGNALFTINGATVNASWTIWGVGGGVAAWKDASGNPTGVAPELNKTDDWQSVVYSIKGKVATLFIDGKNRGTYTFNSAFGSSPSLVSLGLGRTGTTDNTSVEADFDNIALWSKAISSEEEAAALMTQNPYELTDNAPISKGTSYKRVWNYTTQEDWGFMQQNTDGTTGSNPDPKIIFKDGQLKITVRGGSGDRRKASVSAGATTGRYKWRLFLPQREANSNMSVGAFIYNNDEGEIDFEIAAGKASERTKYGAKNDELLAYMTSQGNPFHSTAVPVKPGWHTVELDLSNKNGSIFIQWFIDGKQVKTLQTSLSPSMVFSIWSSVENLGFAGDHPPSKQTTVPFDRAEYSYHP